MSQFDRCRNRSDCASSKQCGLLITKIKRHIPHNQGLSYSLFPDFKTVLLQMFVLFLSANLLDRAAGFPAEWFSGLPRFSGFFPLVFFTHFASFKCSRIRSMVNGADPS